MIFFKLFPTVHKLHMATRAPGSEAKKFYECFPFRDTCDFKVQKDRFSVVKDYAVPKVVHSLTPAHPFMWLLTALIHFYPTLSSN